MEYTADQKRYDKMEYRRCGRSGLLLPAISLGLWHNFSQSDSFDNMLEMVCTAFDNGITHFDLANNYGNPPGAAETAFGRIVHRHLSAYRDQMIVTSKAGHQMWEGPYGDWGSRKSLMASIDQTLGRLGLEYVDIFYSHRYDPQTPLEETMTTLADIVRQGKALYVGLSKYPQAALLDACSLLHELKVPAVVHQIRYSMIDRQSESLIIADAQLGVGTISFSPLAGGILSDRYLQGIPADSRAASTSPFLLPSKVEAYRDCVVALNAIARTRGQSLSQMAIAWQLSSPSISSVLCGASDSRQIVHNLKALENTQFSQEEMNAIDRILRS